MTSSDRPEWPERLAALLGPGYPGLTMVFQPIVRIEDGALLGFEALARFDSTMSDEELEHVHGPNWRLGGHTSEGPSVWFKMADQLDLGVELEVAAICAAFDRIDDLSPGTYVAVNCGPETLVSGHLAKALAGRDLSRVVVELTEHLAILDYAAVRAAIVAVQVNHSAEVCTKVPGKRRNPGIAADDFGAGTASLHHLLALRDVLTFVKLDISMVRDIDTDQGRRDIASMIVGMGTSAGFQVVAEGVEHEAQLVTLRSLGVYAAQGYFLGRPGPLPAPEGTRT